MEGDIMNTEETITMQVTPFEADCIYAIRDIQNSRVRLYAARGIRICSIDWYKRLQNDGIMYRKLVEQYEEDDGK
jgi:hypothetical protein